MNRVEDLDAFLHRTLERFAACDEAGAAGALVDHRCSHGFGLVAGAAGAGQSASSSFAACVPAVLASDLAFFVKFAARRLRGPFPEGERFADPPVVVL